VPFLGRITVAHETDLVENDRPAQLPVKNGNQVTFTLRPFGVKTVRLVVLPPSPLPVPSALHAKPRSDMQIELSWPADAHMASRVSHYNVNRSSRARLITIASARLILRASAGLLRWRLR